MQSVPDFLDPTPAFTARAGPWVSVLVRERSVALALAFGAGLTHALNMFNYPSWVASDQEGVSVYRAWALLQGREGELLSQSPVTTLFLAGWLAATGGSQGFGAAIDGGRMLMLILHAFTVPLLFGLARLLGCGVLAASFAAAFFALSPLVITQQRLVLPDNFASFWGLLGVYLLLRPPHPPLPRHVGGGSWFGNPGSAGEGGRGARRVSWLLRIAGGGSIGLAFFSTELSGGAAAPGNGASLQNLLATLNEPFLALGAAATLANLACGRRDARALLVGLGGTIPLLWLAIDGPAPGRAFALAIPFCLNIGVAVAPALDRMSLVLARVVTTAVVALFVTQYATTAAFAPAFLQRPTAAEREALAWTKAHIPPESAVAVDFWAWPGLAEVGPDGVAFTGLRPMLDVANSEYALVASDLYSPSFARASAVRQSGEPARGGLVKRWVSYGTEVELRKAARIGVTEPAILAGSAHHLARRFERDGAYASLDGTVTAQSQANALLRAVWSGDRASFMRVWRWTAQNLADADGLLASTWRNGVIVSPDTTGDADADAALALLMASRLWTDDELLAAGLRMVEGIWRREVVPVDGRPYPAAGDWAAGSPIIALNPGSFVPYAYEVFATVDPAHAWQELTESSYRILGAASTAELTANGVGLPPDWIGLDTATGSLVPLPGAGRDALHYGEDAARSYWRVALHLRWSGDARAEAYIRGAGILRDEVGRRGAPGRIYSRDGSILDSNPGSAGTAAALAALLTLDPPAAHGLYAAQVVGGASRLGAGIYWGELNDLRAQEWGWLATAFYADRLPDLWGRGLSPAIEPAR